MQHRARVFVAVVVALGASSGCETTEKVAQKPAPRPVANPVPPKLDTTALCQTRAEIDDLKKRGVDPRSVFTEAGGDVVARYGFISSIPNANDRWATFKQDGETHPQSALKALGECEIYSHWKMRDKTEKPCAQAAQRMTNPALVELALGEMELLRGNVDDARSHLDAALAADKGCVAAVAGRAAFETTHGDAKRAATLWADALAVWPQCFTCMVERAKLLEAAGDVEGANALWAQAVAIAPEHPATLKRYAAGLVGRDDEKALAAYEKAIAKGKPDPTTLRAAAQLAEATGDLPRAIQHAEAAAKLQPDDVDTWRLVADLKEKAKDDVGTEAALREILRLLPDDAATHLRLGRYALTTGHLSVAIVHLDAAQRYWPKIDSTSEEKIALDKDLAALKAQLGIRRRPVSGSASTVIGKVQWSAQKVYEERLKKRRHLKGEVELDVETNGEGQVLKVTVANDTLKDQTVLGCLIGNLQAARIDGGAQRLNFVLSFE